MTPEELAQHWKLREVVRARIEFRNVRQTPTRYGILFDNMIEYMMY